MMGIVALLYVLPHALFIQEEGKHFSGIYIDSMSDERFYTSRLRAYTDLKPVANPFIYELRERELPIYYIIEPVLGLAWRILAVDTWQFVLLMNILFPSLIAFFGFLLLYILTRKTTTALIGAMILLLGNELIQINNWATALSDVMRTLLMMGGKADFFLYARPVNPQAVGVLFFAFLALLAHIYIRNKSWKWSISTGLFLGVMPYIYIYYGLFLFVFVACLGITAYVLKKHTLAIQLAIILATGIAIFLPYLFTIAEQMAQSTPTEQASGVYTSGVRYTHTPRTEKVVLAPFIVMLIVLFVKKRKHEEIPDSYVFTTVALLAALICSNQQILTGREIQQHHFHFYVNIPLALLACSILLHHFSVWVRQRSVPYERVLLAVIILFLVWYAVGVQVSGYRNNVVAYHTLQSYGVALDWLTEHIPKYTVIYTDDDVGELITSYSPFYTYSPNAHVAIWLETRERLMHNYFVRMALNNITPTEFPEFIRVPKNRGYAASFLYASYWKEQCGSFACISDAALNNLELEYIQFMKTPLAKNLRKHKIDYLIWDTIINNEWDMKALGTLKEEFASGDLRVYRVL